MMSLSYRELALAHGELQALLVGAPLREVHDDGAHRLFLGFRIPGHNLLCMSCTKPGAVRCHLVEARPASPSPASSFSMLLRKHVRAALCVELLLSPDDRCLRWVFAHADGQRWVLLAELWGRAANVMLLDADDRILGSMHRLRSPLTPGQPYQAASPASPLHQPSTQSRFGSPSRRAELSSADEPSALLALAPLNAELERYYRTHDEEENLRSLREQRHRSLTTQLRRLRRRAAAIEDDLRKARQAVQDRHNADLLSAHFHQLRRGQSSVTVEDLFSNAEPISIPLDPALGPRENIERYYRRAKKFAAAEAGILERLAQTRSQSQELEAELAVVMTATPESLQLGPKPSPAPKRRQEQARRLPYREFTSCTGKTIWVGRSARDNDALSFRHARGNDLWLHASGWRGSHVILRLERGEALDEQSLLDAAALAAHYSKARGDSHTEVYYLPCKYVKRSGEPGRVSLSGAKVINLRLDEERLRRLLSQDAEGEQRFQVAERGRT
ncbi:MAG: NFACT RNA binding domain-containing protein [Myxococcota bacterium]|jgi:predicted ribosome quality control (RQC) complex YloA/Tae2 family protein|nr:NFACT RNA binding domain-containing protein [Myxococcota bacterium]